jgi:parallel beta-helix repeat protein
MQLSDNFNSDTVMVNNPKIGKISPKVHIIGNDGWATFKAEGNCTGEGTSTDPYVISDLEIDAGGSGSGIIIENSDLYFKIKNSTIWNAGASWNNAGINLVGVTNGVIENNTLYNYRCIMLDNSEYNSILNNTISSFSYGIDFYTNSPYNTISNNIIKGGYRAVNTGSNNSNLTIYNNTIISNTYGLDLGNVNHTITNNLLKGNLYGIRIEDSHDSKIFRNTINASRGGGIGLYVIDSARVKIINNTINNGESYAFRLVRCDYSEIMGNIVSYNDENAVQIGSSSHVIFLNNTISFNTGYGLFLNGEFAATNYNQVLNNTIHNNADTGVLLHSSHYNNISNNNVHDNGAYRIQGSLNFNNISYNIFREDAGGGYGSEILISGTNNMIFANHFIYASIYPGRAGGGINYWNSSSIGNYWSSYTGMDANDDGIGDTPFNIYAGDYDFLPIWWDSPQILINSPNVEDIFESSPSFSISVSRGQINSSWYSIDNGITNITFNGLSGVIDNDEWNAKGAGQILLTFYVNDSKGYIGSETVQINKSYDTPHITINSPTLNEVFGFSAPDFIITVNDLSPINTTWYTIDGGLINYTFSGLTGTVNQTAWDNKGTEIITLRFYANDSLGYVGFKDVVIWKDLITPNITINSPIQDEIFGSTSPEFNISIIEENLISTWYTIDGGLTNYTFSGLTGTVNQTAWGNKGTEIITLRFYANDSAGHVGFKDVVIWKDLIAPNITINSPIQDGMFGSTSPEFNISILEENLVSTWYTLEGVVGTFSFTGLTGTIDQGIWDSIPQGEISITFYAEDGAGNIGIESVIVIKSIPSQPEIPGYNISIMLLGFFSITIISLLKKMKKF